LRESYNLTELIWDLNQIGKGIRNLVDGIRVNTTLKTLSLRNVGIGVNGIKLLAEGLKYNSNLETLDLSINQIEYKSFVNLCESLNTNNIRNIIMNNNNLGDDSMKYFANTILVNYSKSNVIYFDFSSCKIYDQGLVYLLNELQSNTIIRRVKLRDNYISHEIDYVVLEFIEKNFHLLSLDLTKNRLSNLCQSTVSRLIERNNKIENEKEMNKLLVEVYKQKYENTKLGEMKEALKMFELDLEAYKQGRADIRTEYENSKRECDEEVIELRKKMERTNILINQKTLEHQDKLKSLEDFKQTYLDNVHKLNNRLIELKKGKQEIELETENIKNATIEMEKNFTIELEEKFKKINENK
jgi:hypothetical protein